MGDENVRLLVTRSTVCGMIRQNMKTRKEPPVDPTDHAVSKGRGAISQLKRHPNIKTTCMWTHRCMVATSIPHMKQ